MKAPIKPGTAIDAKRIAGWVKRFRFYRASPAEDEINAWLDRFSQDDRDLAARVLDAVEVISESEIQNGYKAALESIDGWHVVPSKRVGKWVFTGFGKAGESGQSMLRIFREANGLTVRAHDHLFCQMTEIPKQKLSAEDTIVLVDDFSGSGRQICSRWPLLSELIASDARCIIILTATTSGAKKRIETETELQVLAKSTLRDIDNIFSDRCSRFSGDEKNALLEYCKLADAKNPKGFADCGLLVVLSHKTPNNSIPVLHTNHAKWLGLFPRYLQPV